MVKLFDGLARNLPKGMYLTLFEIKGNKITLQGSADSNGTISKFMRLIEGSEYFTTPNLNVINIKDNKGLRASNFTLKFEFTKAKEKARKGNSSCRWEVCRNETGSQVMRAADFAFRLDDVKNADINDPSSWPVSLKMVLIVIGAAAILFAGYWYIIKDQIAELETRERKEQQLKSHLC